METKKIGLMVVLLVVFAASGAAAFDPPCRMNDMMMQGGGMGMMGGGMGTEYNMGMMGYGRGVMGYGMGMMGYGMDMMGPIGPYGMLDLTPEQNTKINKLLDDLRHQHVAILGKMMDEQAKMRDLFDEEKLDAKKIGAVQDAMSALRKQLLESRVEATNRVREILTKEQRDQLKQLMRGKGYGMNSGMGQGMGGGQMRRNMMGP